MSIKILGITGSRSDYDLLSGLYAKIHSDPNMELGLIVCGAHLLDSFDQTIKYIEQSNLPILAKIKSLTDPNNHSSRVQSAAVCLQNAIEVVKSFQPNLILYPGDREEVIVGALLGAYLKIPTVHFFGGDHTTDGSVDNPIRHATSKLSSLHFVTHKRHKDRLIKMGESKKRIFVIGSPQLDKFRTTPLIQKKNILKQLKKESWDNYALMIQHPCHGSEKKSAQYFEETLQALREEKIRTFVAIPNSDPGSEDIFDVMKKYEGDENFCFYKSLLRELFINLIRHASFMIGNSSAGIYEAPMIPLAAINVGIRQKDRLTAKNVLFVEHGVKNIRKAIRTVLGNKFQNQLKKVNSPYGNGDSVDKAFYLIQKLKLSDYIYKTEDSLYG